MANPIVHFELMVSDPDKAKEFYGKVFDWEFNDTEMPGYTMISTGKDPGGGMMKKPDEAPQFALSVYYLVDDIDEIMKKVEAAGGRVGMPKTEIPNVGYWAFFLDPDGIPVSVFQNK
jgi:predicted enzyme related to lactoylglutathione lyase